jgi:hypothetical protein
VPVPTLAHRQPALPPYVHIACRAQGRRSVPLEVSAPKRMAQGANAAWSDAVDVPDQFFSVKGDILKIIRKGSFALAAAIVSWRHRGPYQPQCRMCEHTMNLAIAP